MSRPPRLTGLDGAPELADAVEPFQPRQPGSPHLVSGRPRHHHPAEQPPRLPVRSRASRTHPWSRFYARSIVIAAGRTGGVYRVRQSRLGLWRTRRTLPERGRLLVRARRPTCELLSVCSGTRVLSRSGGRLRQNATSPSPARIESRRTPCASRVPEGASRCARTPPGVPRPARATELGEVREAPHTRTATELAAAFLGEPRPGPSRTARLDTRPLSRGAPGRNGRVSACKAGFRQYTIGSPCSVITCKSTKAAWH